MYCIDLQTILTVCSEQSGELQANVKHIAGIKHVCQASIVLQSGKVVNCTIHHAGKLILSGEEALNALMKKGILEWEYTPSTAITRSLPAQMSPRYAPEQLSPQYPPAQMSPQHPPAQLSPRYLPAQMSPRYSPAQMSPYAQSSPQTRLPAPIQGQGDIHGVPFALIPMHIQRVTREELATWPRPYRSFYLLSTGEKTVAEIAQLLSLNMEQVKIILTFLVKKGLVSLQAGEARY